MRSHRPGRGHRLPVSTYRLQLTPEFGFAEAALVVPYLECLGITDLYLSPILESGAGSTHGYDVTSHARLSQEKGGGAGFAALVAASRAHGIHLVADIVPNHMTLPTPLWLNTQFWSVLRDGQYSAHAHWFDIDWYTNEHQLLLPLLRAPLEEVLAAGELTRGIGGPDAAEPVVRYADHEFPLRPGTDHLPLPEVLAAQAYRLADWREGREGLNYRRFFDVTGLVAIRVEEPDVLFRTHALLLDLIDAEVIAGLRIDHPDGLADPGTYLAHLARASGDLWVVAEKILEGDEALPDEWACAGTTGYDALARVGGLFLDPDAEPVLTRTYAAFTTRPVSPGPADLAQPMDTDVEEAAPDEAGPGEAEPGLAALVRQAKLDVVTGVLESELARLHRLLAWILPEAEPEAVAVALRALLVATDRYRIYVPRVGGGDPEARGALAALAERARADLAGSRTPLPEVEGATASTLEAALGYVTVLAALAAGDTVPGARPDCAEAIGDFVTRFQQTCGPVMAKGIEDTAFYRHHRLVALNEVGGDPGAFGVPPADFHAYCARRLADWPVTLTTLSTHDTKRSEDVRARQFTLTEFPREWTAWVTSARALAARHRAPGLDAETEYRLWQEVVGAWPVTPERLAAYAQKAVREAKVHTDWATPDPAYEAAVDSFARGVTGDPVIAEHVASWLTLTAASARATVLGQKLVQLTMPGVADTYQGCETVDLSLVDPDNRRPVDFAGRQARLARLDAGSDPEDLDAAKLRLTAAALRLRRRHPEWFVGVMATYDPLCGETETGEESHHLIAYARGDADGPGVIVLATRLLRALMAAGGWGATRVDLPPGPWHDLLSGRDHDGGSRLIGELLGESPVALLVRVAPSPAE